MRRSVATLALALAIGAAGPRPAAAERSPLTYRAARHAIRHWWHRPRDVRVERCRRRAPDRIDCALRLHVVVTSSLGWHLTAWAPGDAVVTEGPHGQPVVTLIDLAVPIEY